MRDYLYYWVYLELEHYGISREDADLWIDWRWKSSPMREDILADLLRRVRFGERVALPCGRVLLEGMQ